MKQTNLKMKEPSHTWIKGTAILSLSVALQAKMCINNRGDNLDNHLAKLKEAPIFQDELKNRVDISKNGTGLLHKIVDTGTVEQLTTLLDRINLDYTNNKKHANPDFQDAVDNKGNTALGKAIQKGRTEMALALIANQHIDILKRDNYNRSPLHIAARFNNREVFNALFKRLCKDHNTAAVRNHLFAKDRGKSRNQERYSVFASAYTPAHQKLGKIKLTNDNKTMFQYVLDTTADYVTKADYDTISHEIDVLTVKKNIDVKSNVGLQSIVTHKKDTHKPKSKKRLAPPPPSPVAQAGVNPPPLPPVAQSGVNPPSPPPLPVDKIGNGGAVKLPINHSKPVKVEPVTDDHDQLLQAIRKGVQLRKVNTEPAKEIQRVLTPQEKLMHELSKELDNRRKDIDPHDDEDEGYTSNENDDEWDV